jgi:hypothetical protein
LVFALARTHDEIAESRAMPYLFLNTGRGRGVLGGKTTQNRSIFGGFCERQRRSHAQNQGALSALFCAEMFFLDR